MRKLGKEYKSQLQKIENNLKSIDLDKEIELAHEFVSLTRGLLEDYNFKELMKIENYRKVAVSFYKSEDIDVIIVLSSIDKLINANQRKRLNKYHMEEANNWNNVDNKQKFLAKIKNYHILKYMSDTSIKESFKSFKK